MKIIKTSFDKLKNGAIIHQVNCHGIVGSHSINTKIFKTFPESKKDFVNLSEDSQFRYNIPLGTLTLSHSNNNMIVFNSYSQDYYGDSTKTGYIYTDLKTLKRNIKKAHSEAKKMKRVLYVPEFIGAKESGEDWETLLLYLKTFPNSLILVKSEV